MIFPFHQDITWLIKHTLCFITELRASVAVLPLRRKVELDSSGHKDVYWGFSKKKKSGWDFQFNVLFDFFFFYQKVVYH